MGVSCPRHSRLIDLVNNRHKWKHLLKYQEVFTPDRMFIHVYRPLDGRKYEWTLVCPLSTLSCKLVEYVS